MSPIPLAEEWAIHDYEGFGDIRIAEYEGLSEVSGLAMLIEEHGEAFTAYAAHVGNEAATEDSFLDAFRGLALRRPVSRDAAAGQGRDTMRRRTATPHARNVAASALRRIAM